MNKKQVENFFIGHEKTPAPLTEQLIKDGYRQKSGGYISYAKRNDIQSPTQYWHLITSWCARSSDETPFTRRIQCGELIFWMAEVSGAVDSATLKRLADEITANYLHNRRAGNRLIQSVCFDAIVRKVESADSGKSAAISKS